MCRISGCVLRFLCILVLAVASLRAQRGTLGQGAYAGISRQPDPADQVRSTKEAGADYRIGNGDVLQISVWGEPELTKTVTVRPDGKISLPLIDEVQVAGMTLPDAQTLLDQRFARYLRTPQASVVVSEIHSSLVYVTGRVRRPGAYLITGSLNVVQLIARAGGLAEHAKEKRVYVLRQAGGGRVDINYKAAIQGRRGSEDVQLLPGDTVVVP
jgi:polysaccharide biosynthesis/export protein